VSGAPAETGPDVARADAALLSTAELEELQRRTAGVTRERMLRELAEAVEAITLEHALLLWFEDLH